VELCSATRTSLGAPDQAFSRRNRAKSRRAALCPCSRRHAPRGTRLIATRDVIARVPRYTEEVTASRKSCTGFPKNWTRPHASSRHQVVPPLGASRSLMSRQPQASSRGATYSQPNRDAPRQIVSGERRMQENEHMPARLQMALVAATIIALYSPGVSLAKPRAHLKAHASQAGMTRFDGFERAAARPFARRKVFFVRDRPGAFYRSNVLSGTSPNQTCHYFGGNGLPVQVCW
jgi:hypothetical protein